MSSESSDSINIEAGLSRDLGLTSALAIGVGTMIAAGIFTLSGLAVRNVGSSAIIAFGMAAVVALFTALTYCEFSSIYPQSGEGYLYARKTFSPPLAYFVGWSLLLGYTSSCAFYVASLSAYFNEFIWHCPVTQLPGVASIVILTLLNIKGTKESGTFQIVVTAAKMLLLLWFVTGGLFTVDYTSFVDRFSSDVGNIASTAAMVFITFFGFSAIAASAGEVIDPVKNIPRAIFISMGLVTVLYTLVVFVMVTAGLSEYSESAMGTAARQFLGPIGGMIIVAGAVFSMVSASNASIMAGSRVALAMSRLGHLPTGIGAIDPKTRTPIVALILVGGTIFMFAVSLELEDLAHFADTVLLLALILVNAALIFHRKRYPDIERPFRVPLVPLLPMIGICANLYLMTQIVHHLTPVLMAASWLVIGLLGFFAWKGMQPEEEALPGAPSRLAQLNPSSNKGKYRVLVPLANPDNVVPLMDLACAIAKERDGEVIALRVLRIPEQLPLDVNFADVEAQRAILEVAHARGDHHGVPVTSSVRVSHSVARAILEAAKKRSCDLIILGWKGYTSTRRKIFGDVMDTVSTHARANIMMVKMVGDGVIDRLLVPTAGGAHARCAEQYAASIARFNDASITVCHVSDGTDAGDDAESQERIAEVVNRLQSDDETVVHSDEKPLQIEGKTITSRSIEGGILEEARPRDAIIVGATRKSIYPQIVFGSIPEHIARQARQPVIVVKHHHPVAALVGRVMGS